MVDRRAHGVPVRGGGRGHRGGRPGRRDFGRGVYLIALVRAHVGVVTEDIERASVFVHEWRALQGRRRDEIARRRDAYEARFRAVIADGVGTGAFARSIRSPTAAYILTALNGLVAWYEPDGRLSTRGRSPTPTPTCRCAPSRRTRSRS